MANHVLSDKMMSTINEIGNALTKAGWPSYEVIEGQPHESKAHYYNLVTQQQAVRTLETDFHDCVNELCLKCGSYKEEHNGACDGCRWLEPRRGW